jgi:ketopantoate reductase
MAKIAVVGCGAMGSVYAALMVDAGHEVRIKTNSPGEGRGCIMIACADRDEV